MKCPKCQREISDNSVFCSFCGERTDSPATEEKLESEASKDSATFAETSSDAEIKTSPEADDGGEACAENTDTANEAAKHEQEPTDVELEVVDANKRRVKTGKDREVIKRWSGIVLSLTGLILLIWGITAGIGAAFSREKEIDYTKIPVVFVNEEDEVMFVLENDKEPRYLCTEDEDLIDVTRDGKYIFFGSDIDGREYDLCRRKTSVKSAEKGTEEIVKGISDCKISPDGKTLYFIKNTGLYKSNLKKHDKIAEDVSRILFISSDNGVVYRAEDGIFYTEDKWCKKIAETDDYITTFFDKDGGKILTLGSTSSGLVLSLCGTGKNDKPFKIADEVEVYKADAELDEIYFIKNGTLYYYDGKKTQKVMNNASRLAYVKDGDDDEFFVSTFADTNDGFEQNLYMLDQEDYELLLADYRYSSADESRGMTILRTNTNADDIVYIRDGERLVEAKLPNSDLSTCFVHDGYFYFIDYEDSSSLTRYKIGKKSVNFDKGEFIADDVEYAVTDRKDGKLVIRFDDGSAYMYDGKLREISIDFDGFVYADGGFFFEDYNSENYTRTLSYFDGKKSKVYAQDVIQAVCQDEKLVYFLNEDGELYRTAGKKQTLICEDVDDLYRMDPDMN